MTPSATRWLERDEVVAPPRGCCIIERVRALLLLLLVPLGCGAPDRPADQGASSGSLPELSFLQGSWRAEEGDRRTDEMWLPIGTDSWLGFARTSSIADGSTLHHELMRLERAHGGLRYVAAPAGQATTSFPLVRAGEREALFANPAHDFPNWIRYARLGEELRASIGREGEEAAAQWRYQRRASEPRPIEEAGRACLEEGELRLEFSGCHCAAELFCAGFEVEGGVALGIAELDSACDACTPVRGTCTLPAGAVIEVNGRPLRIEEGCAPARLPVLFAGEP